MITSDNGIIIYYFRSTPLNNIIKHDGAYGVDAAGDADVADDADEAENAVESHAFHGNYYDDNKIYGDSVGSVHDNGLAVDDASAAWEVTVDDV
jgi:hypothetical protein